MSVFFVGGAGTDVGKTFTTELLIRDRLAHGFRAAGFKPVASGVPDLAHSAFQSSDTARLLRAQGARVNEKTVGACSPWRYAAPLSPDMAAALERREQSFETLLPPIRRSLAEAPADASLFVEGVGGVMSPLCQDATNLDLIQALDCPTLLVSGSYLGAISHCLTALEALKARQAPVACVIVNECGQPPVSPEATAAAIARFAPRETVAILKRDARGLPPIVHVALARA